MVSAAKFGFQVAPDAMERPDRCASFIDVVDAILVEHLFEIAAEAGSLERFGQEVALQRLVLQVFADVGEALLAVLKSVDERAAGRAPSRAAYLHRLT